MRRWLALGTLLMACSTTPPPTAPPPAGAHDHGGHQGHHGQHGNRFDDADAWAKVFDDPARDAWQQPDAVVALLDIKPGMTVVDLGAGTGYFMARLSRAVGPDGRVIPTDIEDSMVQHMKARAHREQLMNVEPRQTPPDDPQLPPAGVDRVLVVDVWHHLPDPAAYARKLAASLRPGGALMIVDFTRESAHGPPPEMRIPPADVVAALTAAGLSASIAAESLPDQYVVVGKR